MENFCFGKVRRYGVIFIVSGPSGAGKSSICKKVLDEDDNLSFSISCTTRSPRKGEIDGVDYRFTDLDKFEKLIREDEFVEYAKVHDNYYGTLKSEVIDRVKNGQDVLLDIDVQGALKIKDVAKNNEILSKCCEYVFITPPDCEELERRLRGRGTEKEEVVQKRLLNSKGELAKCMEYDFLIVNDELSKAISDLKAVITALRQRTSRLK